MERQIYSDQSTAFDHVNEEKMVHVVNKSETLQMRNQLSAFTVDCLLIVGILIITFYII